jgi:DNA polymerase-3 subunit gamma/tau
MEYRVLARKYRPVNFDALIGQDVLVRTLSNAIASGRIAHAFLLTGIRGVGKTTTARIIARALNCIGEDGAGGPTINPCGVCANCTMIGEDRHVDVLEIDAASHTGVGDIRELIDGVRYLPSSARYKVYIIDEVHMLSNSAFNALLKTLEEPPPHVKFVFATTESRKIPVTILSRCQRFDLKRIDSALLASHLAAIAGKEQVQIDAEALRLIAIAAEGSVRDSLSLLDQAIARGSESGQATQIDAALVRAMLGAADNTATFALLEALLAGDVAAALSHVRARYHDGSDPLLMVQEALEATHLITRAKVAPQALQDGMLSEHERASAAEFAARLTMPAITRLWQMLLKGVSEVRHAPSPIAALEMLLVRIAYAASLPTPADMLKNTSQPPQEMPRGSSAMAPQIATPTTIPTPAPATGTQPMPVDFVQVVALFERHREPLLHTQLVHDARLVAFEPGKITLQLPASLPRDFPARVSDCLSRWTGQPWKLVLAEAGGSATLHEQAEQLKQQKTQEAAKHPLVASVLEQFPGATITHIH